MIQSATVQAVVNQVTNSLSSIFTKEDVLKLIEGMNYGIEREKELLVEQEVEAAIQAAAIQAVALTEDQIKGLTEAIVDEIESSIEGMRNEDIVDFNSAEFSIDYKNKLSLDCIEIERSNIIRAATEDIQKQIIGYLDFISKPVETVEVEE